MARLLSLMESDLGAPWSQQVGCTDASMQGIGVCVATMPVDEVAEVARWNERWRFARLDPSEWQPRLRNDPDFLEITDPHTVEP